MTAEFQSIKLTLNIVFLSWDQSAGGWSGEFLQDNMMWKILVWFEQQNWWVADCELQLVYIMLLMDISHWHTFWPPLITNVTRVQSVLLSCQVDVCQMFLIEPPGLVVSCRLYLCSWSKPTSKINDVYLKIDTQWCCNSRNWPSNPHPALHQWSHWEIEAV